MKSIKINATEYKTNEVFKFLRQALDLTQKETALIVNKNKSSIEKYEYGTMEYSFETLVKLAKNKNLEILIQNKKH